MLIQTREPVLTHVRHLGKCNFCEVWHLPWRKRGRCAEGRGGIIRMDEMHTCGLQIAIWLGLVVKPLLAATSQRVSHTQTRAHADTRKSSPDEKNVCFCKKRWKERNVSPSTKDINTNTFPGRRRNSTGPLQSVVALAHVKTQAATHSARRQAGAALEN